MDDNVEKLGVWIKAKRKELGITQRSLALTSGTGLRFIIDLEKGKSTCQIGKVLSVVHTLGATITIGRPEEPEIKL